MKQYQIELHHLLFKLCMRNTKRPGNSSRLAHDIQKDISAPNASPKPPTASPHISGSQSLHHTRAIHKSRAENAIRIGKHAVLQTDDDKLAPLEARANQPADVLRVREIERRVHFVQDVHGGWRVLEKGEDEGEGDEGAG